MNVLMTQESQHSIFMHTLFYVLGFTAAFSLLGVFVQTILQITSVNGLIWIGRIGGLLVIFFGLQMMGLFNLPFLNKEHKLKLNGLTKSYWTSFIFGVVFAVGWTPCIGPVLGAVLSLTTTAPALAFIMLVAYSIGMGIPFLVIGLFTERSKSVIHKYISYMPRVRQFFGAVLIILGIAIFMNQLYRISSYAFRSDFFTIGILETLGNQGTITILISFLAGLVSFLSPCVLPLLPAFLTYLSSAVINQKN